MADKSSKKDFNKQISEDYKRYKYSNERRDETFADVYLYRKLSSVSASAKSALGYACLLCVVIGFICVLFGNPFDSESFFRTLISADYAPFSLDDFITGAHNILPDDVGIFNGIENLFIAIGCLGYSIGFLINLVFALLFA